MARSVIVGARRTDAMPSDCRIVVRIAVQFNRLAVSQRHRIVQRAGIAVTVVVDGHAINFKFHQLLTGFSQGSAGCSLLLFLLLLPFV